MTEPVSYTSVVDDLWRVVRVLKFTPIDQLIEATRTLQKTAPDAGYLNGTLTPRRLQRNERMLTALESLQSQLKAIDATE